MCGLTRRELFLFKYLSFYLILIIGPHPGSGQGQMPRIPKRSSRHENKSNSIYVWPVKYGGSQLQYRRQTTNRLTCPIFVFGGFLVGFHTQNYRTSRTRRLQVFLVVCLHYYLISIRIDALYVSHSFVLGTHDNNRIRTDLRYRCIYTDHLGYFVDVIAGVCFLCFFFVIGRTIGLDYGSFSVGSGESYCSFICFIY